MPRLRLAMAQTNPTVGDVRGNAERLMAFARDAHAHGADVFLSGELALTGYPIEDLALRDNFLESATQAASDFARWLDAEGLGDMVAIIGHPEGPSKPTGVHSIEPPARAYNCVSVMHRGTVIGRYRKHHLPNYAVFDEFRTFLPGTENLILRLAGVDLGIVICEDLWRDEDPIASLSAYPLSALLVPNASPFERDKDAVRLPLVTRRAREMNTTVCYVNIVGGQDDLVFDGDSMVVTPAGERLATGARFDPDLLVVDLDLPHAEVDAAIPAHTERIVVDGHIPRTQPPLPERPAPERDDLEIVWRALVTGTRDYVEKNGFSSVVLGLSGGIDSAVCATLAADALGPSRVHGVALPSVHSSEHSLADAKELASRLGIGFRVESIADLVAPVDQQLGLTGLAAENVQARIRGVVLMGISNMEGHLVLTTGNKSELAVGYSTIYGDSVGGFAPIKDVPKTLVWELARWRNARAESLGEAPPIPENSITKAPSAELRPGQTDQDSLPDYAVLDQVLELLVVQGLDEPQIVAQGFDEDLVRRVVTLVSKAEWKRRQGAPGPRISSVAFGRDRRLPITSAPTTFTLPR